MKLLLLSFVILASACGKYDVVGTGSKIGGPLDRSPLTSLDRTNLAQICNALATKSIVANTTLNFSTIERDCTENTITSGDVATNIQQVGNTFVLKRKSDGTNFMFPDVETASAGLLQDVCSNVAGFQSPLNTGSELVSVTTTGPDIAECGSEAENLCVVVQRANTSDGIVHTKDWMRVKISDVGFNGKLGYFTLRMKKTRSFCGLNEQLTFRAELK